MGWRLKNLRVHHVPEGCPLTERQFECVVLLADGLDYETIAAILSVSTSTVRTHLHVAYEKLGAVNGASAVAEAWRRGWMGWRTARVSRPVRVSPMAMRAPFLHAYLRAWEAAGYPMPRLFSDDEAPAHHAAAMRLALLAHRLVVDS